MLLILLVALAIEADTNDGRLIRILFTNNSNGKLVNCNCRNDPLGGLAERASFIIDYRAKHDDVVLVDSGGYLGLSDSAESGQLVFDLMQYMAYDAIGIGDQELYNGLDTFLGRFHDTRDSIISASIRDRYNETIFTPWKIVTVNDVRIGIIGLASPETFRFFPEERMDFNVPEPDSILGKILPALEENCDVILILSQMGFEEDKIIAKQWPSIGLIIGGHSQTLLNEPYLSDNTIIVQAGKSGGRVGEIVLNIDKNSTIQTISHQLIEIDDSYGVPPDVQTMLDSAGILSK